MASVLKVLGQQAPAGATDTTLYTVPSSTSTVLSSLTICNFSGTQTEFTISIRPNGATLENKHYLYYSVAIGGNDTFVATLGITLDSSDVITVRALNGTLAFQAFGEEIS